MASPRENAAVSDLPIRSLPIRRFQLNSHVDDQTISTFINEPEPSDGEGPDFGFIDSSDSEDDCEEDAGDMSSLRVKVVHDILLLPDAGD